MFSKCARNDQEEDPDDSGPPAKKMCVRPPNQKVGSSAVENKSQISKRTALKKVARIRKLPLMTMNILEEVKEEICRDDDDGHLLFDLFDSVAKYTLIGYLGKGTYGRVARARHKKSNRRVALKIIRNRIGCRESGESEIRILCELQKIDPDGENFWVQAKDWFYYHGHVCIAFELLGDSLYAFLRDNNFQPFPLPQIRHIAYQMLYSVMALHDNGIIHTDLKPDNFCFVSSDFTYGIRTTRQQSYRRVINTDIRLIDFGCAVKFSEENEGCIQTRPFRAPEVIFGLKWSSLSDLWSLGCTLFELYTGYALFPASDDDEHAVLLREVLGPIPEMFHETKLFKKNEHELTAFQKRRSKNGPKPLKKYMLMATREHTDFFDLIEQLLQYDPEDRIPLSEALNHPFFNLLSDDLKKFEYD